MPGFFFCYRWIDFWHSCKNHWCRGTYFDWLWVNWSESLLLLLRALSPFLHLAPLTPNHFFFLLNFPELNFYRDLFEGRVGRLSCKLCPYLIDTVISEERFLPVLFADFLSTIVCGEVDLVSCSGENALITLYQGNTNHWSSWEKNKSQF